jgi:hypothetical protein
MNYLLYCIAWSIYTNCHMNDIAIVHMKTKSPSHSYHFILSEKYILAIVHNQGMNDIATEIAEQYKRQKQGTAGTAALTTDWLLT